MGEVIRNKKGQTEEEFLREYDAAKYPSPFVTVDNLIFTINNKEEENYRKLPEKELKVLLVKRGDFPDIGAWALPGGFIEMDEDLKDAAKRELFEESGLKSVYLEQLESLGRVNRDKRHRVISVAYMALIDSSTLDLKAGDDADDAKWFSLKSELASTNKEYTETGYVLKRVYKLSLKNTSLELNPLVQYTKTVEGKSVDINYEVIEKGGMAFDHAEVIQYGLERLRNKVEYTSIAFNLMPELFTLTELQKVYEILLDKELLKASFRRKINHLVEETNNIKKGAGHAPAVLYRYNPKWEDNI